MRACLEILQATTKAERELLPGRRDGGRRNDARPEMVAICEHTEVPGHVKPRRRYEGAAQLAGGSGTWRGGNTSESSTDPPISPATTSSEIFTGM